jgi:hypothetical protein
MRRGQLAVAKRYGISELTIYKGCKRSSGFQAINIKRLTQPTSGAINLSSVSFWAVWSHRSARVAAILGYAQLSCLAPPCRWVMERATSSCAGFICNPMARDERLEPAVKPVGLKRDRHDQAGAPRGLSALPRSIAQPGRIRPWLVPRRRHPRRLSNGPRSPPQQHVVVPIVIGWLLNLLLQEGSLLRCIIGYFASAPSAASAQLKRLSQSGLRMS